MYEGNCLTDDEVIDYVRESAPQMKAMETHVRTCNSCRRRVRAEDRFEQRSQLSAIRNDDLRDEFDEKYGPGWRTAVSN